MDFDQAIDILNTLLVKEEPVTFRTSWIIVRAPQVYRFIHKNIRTENNEIDWDTVTKALDRSFQKRWRGRRRQPKKLYENRDEVDLILNKYREKIYTFIASSDEKDRNIRDRIIVSLVRLAQKGNIIAKQEAVALMRYTADDWIEKYYVLSRWPGYEELLQEQLEACIRRYRFTGSFMGYVFRTLQYVGRGLRSTSSLDKEIFPGKTLGDSVVQDSSTGQARVYERGYKNF
jgi:hypothetical protein